MKAGCVPVRGRRRENLITHGCVSPGLGRSHLSRGAPTPYPAAAANEGAWRALLESTGAAISGAFEDCLEAVRRRAFIKQEVVAALREVDVIAMATGSSFGDRWDARTATIHGSPNDEALLYRVAYAYEQATEWHKMVPPL